MSEQLTHVPPDPLSASARQGRGGYAAFTVGLIALGGYLSILPVFRQHLQHYLGISDWHYGLLFSLPSVAMLAPALAGGWLVDRWGPRRVLHVSLLGSAAALLIFALSGRLWLVMAAALCLAKLFSVPMDLASNAYLVRLYPQRRRRVLSLNLAARSAAEMVVLSLGEGWLILVQAVPAISFGLVLHAPFALVAAAFLAGALLYRGRAAAGDSRWHWRDLLISSRSAGLVLLMALHGACDAALWIWLPRFLGGPSFEQHSILRPGVVLSAYSLAYLVARTTLAFVPERLGRRTLLVLPGILGGGVLVAGFASGSYLFAAWGYVVGGLLWSVEYPAMLSLLAEREQQRLGSALATASVCSLALTAVVVAVAGRLVDTFGAMNMTGVMIGLACGFPVVGLGGALWLATGRRHRATP